jgi:UDP-glucuronate decarboxylase
MKSAEDVVQTDLAYMAEHLRDEFAQMSGKNLLIIGGAGFLGYYLVQSVLHYNDVSGRAPVQLTVLDNYMRGMPDWLKALEGRPDLTLRKHDVLQPLPSDLPAQDYLIHAASIASPIYYRQFPIETMDANVDGLRLLLEYARGLAAAGTPMSGFLFYSTSEIYGDPTADNIPTPETYRGNVSCTGPRACYDESKRYGETLCVNFAQVHNVPVRMARPFNNYGPGLKITDGRVLPDFARDIFAGRDIVMLSDGAPTRTFCYIADAIVGYYKILVRGRSGEAYNIGVETPEISMAELAERVTGLAREMFGYTGKVVRGVSEDKEYLTDNPNRRCPIIEKARTELGYAPSIGPEEGLKRALIWYSGNQVAENA